MSLAFNRSMPSPKPHNFARAVPPSVQRSVFDRSTAHKTTLDAGLLYPVLCDELLPADTVNMRSTVFARVNPMVVPPMDNLYLDLHAYFVPARLVWENWVKLMGEQKDVDSSIDYVVPHLYSGDSPGDDIQFSPGSIYDYFGLPVSVPLVQAETDEQVRVMSLPFRAYNLIWNEWYRDQNFQNSVSVPLGDGPDSIGDFALLRRGKRHDYFTSSLPSPQKGPQVTISLAGTAPVIGNGDVLGLQNATVNNMGLASGTVDSLPGVLGVEAGTAGDPAGLSHDGFWSSSPNVGVGVSTDPNLSGLIANLGSVSVLSINELRTAVATQQLLELYARSGTRYTEILQAEFDVFPEDARLQRPEFLGGSSQLISMDAVPQTSQPTEDNPQASLAANGHVVSQLQFSYNVKEHGFLIILASVRADLTYQQGLRRMWSRRTRYDFYHPAFANLGEQAVLRKEFQAVDSVEFPEYNNSVWGYQERYAEYRYFPSLITGKFRSVDPQSLDAWHYALDYDGSAPQLDSIFIEDNPPLRALAIPSEPAFFADFHFGYRHARPIPVFSVPGLRRF